MRRSMRRRPSSSEEYALGFVLRMTRSHSKPLLAPVLVREQRLPHERRLLEALDLHEQDRVVARDADRPQPRDRRAGSRPR